MDILPTSSRNTPEGDLILSSFLAAVTAAFAALRMALITPDRPALIPAVKPDMAFTPTERSVVPVRLAAMADLTVAAMAMPVPLMLKPVIPEASPSAALVPVGLSVSPVSAVVTAVSTLVATVEASVVKSCSVMPTPTPAATLSPTGFTRVEGDWIPSAVFRAVSRFPATVSASLAKPASVIPCAMPSRTCAPVPVTSSPFRKATMLCRFCRSVSDTACPC